MVFLDHEKCKRRQSIFLYWTIKKYNASLNNYLYLLQPSRLYQLSCCLASSFQAKIFVFKVMRYRAVNQSSVNIIDLALSYWRPLNNRKSLSSTPVRLKKNRPTECEIWQDYQMTDLIGESMWFSVCHLTFKQSI